MNSEARLSDADRDLLRDALRTMLERHWPPETAVADAADAARRLEIWHRLVEQGVATLGRDAQSGGVREAVLAIGELGAAHCPAPLVAGSLLAYALGHHAAELDAWVDSVESGRAIVCCALDFGDAPLTERQLGPSGLELQGRLRFVEGAEGATHLLVPLAGRDALALVELGAPGVAIRPLRHMNGPVSCDVVLDAVAAKPVAIGAAALADLRDLASLLLVARACGAARRAFDLAVAYAKERRQFGRPIGAFQAIQHKLANGFIALEGVRLCVDHAARRLDDDAADRGFYVAAAVAYASDALKKLALETQHAFGAIGYAEEHEAPRHFRRVHLDCLAASAGGRSRQALAAWLLDGASPTLPSHDLGPDGNAFRDEVRAWLAANWSGARREAFDRRPFKQREFDEEFARDFGRTGWNGLSWPERFGGQGRGPHEQLALIEEMERVEAPRVGAAVQANALLMFGTAEQQRRYLPEILAGQAMHGMGYSEPDAGSDLASLKTRASWDGEAWVIEGQKIWTTTWWGRYMFLAARTDPDAGSRHAGISMFIVPMDAPGITIRPATTMYDGSFANIFYDGVRVPADAIVGEPNQGWRVLTSALAAERGLVGGGIVSRVVHQFEMLCERLRRARADGPRPADDPLVRDRVAQLAAEIEVGRQLMLECATLAARTGATPPEYAAVSKVFSSELLERHGEAALEMLGLAATLSQGSDDAIADGRFEQSLRHSLMWVISIGTNEIQRTLIAQRGLGLPR